jgi:hypothetical protein
MKKALLVAFALAAIAIPTAAATPPNGVDHKVTICHFTGKAPHVFVVITVDNAAFLENPAGQGHNPAVHHQIDTTGPDAEYLSEGCDPKNPPPDPKFDT